MTRIGRDHGRFVSEVAQLSMEEIHWYEAIYRVEAEEAKKAQDKALQQSRR